MKNLLSQKAFLIISFVAGIYSLQACSPANDVKPITPVNTISVKVKDTYAPDGTEQTKHLVISSSINNGGVILDTMVTGSFTYSFNTTETSVSVSATLSANSAFVSSLEVDRNNVMDAYHDGTCGVKEFDITDNLSF